MRLTAIWTEGPFFTLTGAEVGEVSLDGTLSLIGSAAQASVIVGIFYAAVRWALPPDRAPSVFALLTFLLPGGIFFGDDEFELFDPSLLTAALFVPLFPLGGFALAALVERFDPRPPREWTRNGRVTVAAIGVVGLALILRNVVRLA
jgi:hypothetical protein